MKLITSIALASALSLASTAALAAPTAQKAYAGAYGYSSFDSATRITVTDNSGDPINVSIEGTPYSWIVSPDGPNYVLTIRADEGGYTDLVITDLVTHQYTTISAYDHDDVNVHPGLEIGVSLKK